MASAPRAAGQRGDDHPSFVEECKAAVTKEGFLMKRDLDDSKLPSALRHASNMIHELRTSRLSSPNYYDLYMMVIDELRHLEQFIEDDQRADDQGRFVSASSNLSLTDLYEKVQHAGNIVPRLYLLVLVASIFLNKKTCAPMEILFDLLEMCKGVQHPVRGLFLRSFLSQQSKAHLPDVPEGHKGAIPPEVEESIEFVLQNFSEMTRLWVRMQHQGAVRDRARREQQRRRLRMLVGTNLVRLSSLNAVGVQLYASKVLPRILKQTLQSKDRIAQEYLMDCVVQVFPDAFHLRTLETFLQAIPKLQKDADMKTIIISMLNRLASPAGGGHTGEAADGDGSGGSGGGSGAASDHVDELAAKFPLFQKYASQIVEASSSMTLQDTLQVEVSLVHFATKAYQGDTAYIDSVFEASCAFLEKQEGIGVVEAAPEILELLSGPLEADVLPILRLPSFLRLREFLNTTFRKRLAVLILHRLAESSVVLIDDAAKLQLVFDLCHEIVAQSADLDEERAATSDEYEFREEQELVAQLLSRIVHPGVVDTDVAFEAIKLAHAKLEAGGPLRCQYVMPPIVYAALALAPMMKDRKDARVDSAAAASAAAAAAAGDADDDEEASAASAAVAAAAVASSKQKYKPKKAFQLVHDLLATFAVDHAETALRLSLHAGLCADRCDFEDIAYQFLSGPFEIFEQLAEAREKFAALVLIIGTVEKCTSLSPQNYETLAANAASHSAKLVKKEDQIRAIHRCAHLFWAEQNREDYRRVKTVSQCLTRCVKIATGLMSAKSKFELLTEVLDKFVYFFDKGCESVDAEKLSSLVQVVYEVADDLDAEDDATAAVRQHFDATVALLRSKKPGSGHKDTDERFAAIHLDHSA